CPAPVPYTTLFRSVVGLVETKCVVRLEFGGRPYFLLPRLRFALNFAGNFHERRDMAKYVCLLQFTDQGIRTIKDTTKRAAAATAEAEKMGAKITDSFWTMGAYDVVIILDAPDDMTASAFTAKVGSLGNVKTHTMRAFD